MDVFWNQITRTSLQWALFGRETHRDPNDHLVSSCPLPQTSEKSSTSPRTESDGVSAQISSGVVCCGACGDATWAYGRETLGFECLLCVGHFQRTYHAERDLQASEQTGAFLSNKTSTEQLKTGEQPHPYGYGSKIHHQATAGCCQLVSISQSSILGLPYF